MGASDRRSPPRRPHPAPRAAHAPAPAPRPAPRPRDLAQLVAAADDLERALDALEEAPGAREAALGELARRSPGYDEPSPWSTAILVRLAGRLGGRDGLEAVVPFLADVNALVQVEAAEALDATPLGELRAVLERLARRSPDGAFWEAVIGLLESREERGICRLVADLATHLAAPAALAAALEALPYLADSGDLRTVREALGRFTGDTRAVPGAETEDGPLTLALVADLALQALREAEAETRSDGER